MNPGQNSFCPAGGFFVWRGMHGAEDIEAAIAASNTDMAALYRENAQANQIIWLVWVVLRVIVGTCRNLIHCLLGPLCLLVKDLQDLIVTVNKCFSYLSVQMTPSHWCTSLAFDVSCVINVYRNACIKASATESLSDPEGRTLASFQFIINDLDHRCYLVQTRPPSLQQLLLAQDKERAALARISREPVLASIRSRTGGGCAVLLGGGVETPIALSSRLSSPEGKPVVNPRPIQCLHLFLGDTTSIIYCNVTLPIVGGLSLCELCHMGMNLF